MKYSGAHLAATLQNQLLVRSVYYASPSATRLEPVISGPEQSNIIIQESGPSDLERASCPCLSHVKIEPHRLGPVGGEGQGQVLNHRVFRTTERGDGTGEDTKLLKGGHKFKKDDKLLHRRTEDDKLLHRRTEDDKLLHRRTEDDKLLHRRTKDDKLLHRRTEDDKLLHRRTEDDKLLHRRTEDDKLLHRRTEDDKLLHRRTEDDKLLHRRTEDDKLLHRRTEDDKLLHRRTKDDKLLHRRTKDDKLLHRRTKDDACGSSHWFRFSNFHQIWPRCFAGAVGNSGE
ncbi:hypothetical protein RRG08_051126 [Elysia crispata]|uniref:Uncharacterized protein n=1 Tax=Elysia crispata TaxID=231223 RepID=A0AAE1DYV5_9GAST|nr:hypothetical protein RRG08_051126 [Elysia crispata]